MLTASPLPTVTAPTQVDELEVVGRYGAALMAPRIEFRAGDIDAFAARDIGDVIGRTMRSLGARDAPLVIVNGRRVPNPEVYFGFPPDALTRVEALPAGAAAVYGAEPTRPVLNIVLQQAFASRDGQLTAISPTDGGMSSWLGDLRRSTINGFDTTQVGLRLSRSTSLRAGERSGYLEGHPESGALTLRPQSESGSANLTVTRMIRAWSATFGAAVQFDEFHSVILTQQGPNRDVRRNGGVSMSAGLSGALKGWSIQNGINVRFGRTNQAGWTDYRSTDAGLVATLAASRTLRELPAGPLVANLSGQFAPSRVRIETSERGVSRWSYVGDLGASFTVPLAGPALAGDNRSITALGSLSLTVGGALKETDAGDGGGLNVTGSWSPLTKLGFNGSWSRSIEGLTSEVRFAPPTVGPAIVVYDFRTGESAQAETLLGGNPDLKTPKRDQLALGVSFGPLTRWAYAGSISLQRTAATGGLDTLPTPTPQVEAAFPGRFIRGADGRLIRVDQRPINLQSASTDALSSSITFSVPLGRPAGSAAPGALRIALNHTLLMRDRVVIRRGLPEMDRLAGDGAAAPRQEVSLLLDGNRGRWGVNSTVRWRGPYRVRRDFGQDGPEDLRIAGMSFVDVRVSYLVERTIAARRATEPPRRGAGLRIEVAIDNLFDARPTARVAGGRIAPGYGRDDQDPVGRTLRIDLSRRF